MARAFDQIRAKVTRAKQHVQDFQLALLSFQQSKPYRIGIKEDSESDERIYYLAHVEPVPFETATIAADVLQNLRSALDHIAFQLVLDANGPAAAEWRVHYPVTKSPADYKTTRQSQIKGVGQAVIDAIDATEPYPGGKGHALWQLSTLNNADKHRLLVATGSFYAGVNISPIIRDALNAVGAEMPHDLLPAWFVAPANRQLSLKTGDELFIESLNQKVHEDLSFAIGVAFDAPGVVECEPALKTLQDLTNLVDGLVAKFEPFFP